MRLLFDHGVPAPLRRFLIRHEVILTKELGWEGYVNGRLITAAEQAGFEAIVTCDKNVVYQQNLAERRIALAVLPTNIWPHLQPYVTQIVAFIDGIGRGAYQELQLPRPALNRRPPPQHLP